MTGKPKRRFWVEQKSVTVTNGLSVLCPQIPDSRRALSRLLIPAVRDCARTAGEDSSRWPRLPITDMSQNPKLANAVKHYLRHTLNKNFSGMLPSGITQRGGAFIYRVDGRSWPVRLFDTQAASCII